MMLIINLVLIKINKPEPQEKEFEEAVYYYVQGLQVDPNYFYLLYNLGSLYNSLNMLETAIHYFSKAY